MANQVLEGRSRTLWFSGEQEHQLQQLIAKLDAKSIKALGPGDVVRYAIQQLYQEQFGEGT